MKTIQLYLLAEKPPYLNGKRIRFIGLLIYLDYMRIYCGSVMDKAPLEVILFGVLKGLEFLKQQVNIEVFVEEKKVIDQVNKQHTYSGVFNKIINKYPRISWNLYDYNDPKGIFLYNELNKRSSFKL